MRATTKLNIWETKNGKKPLDNLDFYFGNLQWIYYKLKSIFENLLLKVPSIFFLVITVCKYLLELVNLTDNLSFLMDKGMSIYYVTRFSKIFKSSPSPFVMKICSHSIQIRAFYILCTVIFPRFLLTPPRS